MRWVEVVAFVMRECSVVVFGVEREREGRKKGADLGILGASRGLLRCLVDVLVWC